MSVSPPGYWLLNRIVYLINKTLELINTTVSMSIQDLLNNANTFKGINTFTQGIDVNNINSINGNTTFNSNIVVDGDILANNANFIGDKLFINDISLKNSAQSYIIVSNDIRFNKDIIVNGDLTINGTSFSVNSETLTINDRFIVLNANLESLQVKYTDPAGIIVETHNSTQHNKGYLLWTLFDPNNPLNEDLNRTWDLSGDNLRGNVLKATTLRGNILDSYNSPNISIISDIDMNNNDISNINTLTASDLNIDIIKTNTRTNISVLNTIDMNNNYIINANIAGLNNSQIYVENGIINSENIFIGLPGGAGGPNGIFFESFGGLLPLNFYANYVAKVVLHDNVLYLPENHGFSINADKSQSIIGISGVYKDGRNAQQLLNSQCYLIPPSMITDVSELRGTTLFETIATGSLALAGHTPGLAPGISGPMISTYLKNTLVPTVGQIVDLLIYLGVDMNGKQNNLISTN
jgi:hypothetical protein